MIANGSSPFISGSMYAEAHGIRVIEVPLVSVLADSATTIKYMLVADDLDGEGEYEVLGNRKKTKADVDRWIWDKEVSRKIDWRFGYKFKFRNSQTIYDWLTVKKMGIEGVVMYWL